MKLLRYIPTCAAAMGLMLTPALPAFQMDQATAAATKAEKKARTKAKKAADQTTEMTGKSGAATAKEATGTAEKSMSPTPETTKTRKAKTEAAGSAQRAMPTVSESEINAAKTSGKVWVNTDTGVYHKGGQWYGTTKQGKFMTEDEAIKAGYRASKTK